MLVHDGTRRCAIGIVLKRFAGELPIPGAGAAGNANGCVARAETSIFRRRLAIGMAGSAGILDLAIARAIEYLLSHERCTGYFGRLRWRYGRRCCGCIGGLLR